MWWFLQNTICSLLSYIMLPCQKVLFYFARVIWLKTLYFSLSCCVTIIIRVCIKSLLFLFSSVFWRKTPYYNIHSCSFIVMHYSDFLVCFSNVDKHRNTEVIYFIFGCTCFPLMCLRPSLVAGVWASHCGAFPCCRAWTLGYMGFNSCIIWA